MSLNLGEAVEAARKLHTLGGEPAAMFEKIRDGFLAQSRRYMNAALDAPPTDRHVAVGYARAMRDVYTALEAAAHGVAHARVEQHGPATSEQVKRAPR